MSTKIERDQLVSKLRGVQGKIKSLKNQAQHSYKTMHKFLPNIGKICELETEVELVRAHAYVKSETKTLEDSANELGVKLKTSQLTLLGFSSTTWFEEIKIRLNEITRDAQLRELKTVESVLIDNMTEDDRFDLEVGNAAKLSVLDDIDSYADYSDDAE